MVNILILTIDNWRKIVLPEIGLCKPTIEFVIRKRIAATAKAVVLPKG
jgi:hypothetical protein